jgi:DNA polymerase-3 subunit epsilon
MTVISFDFETNGLPLWNVASDDPRQPHIVQMALVVYTDTGLEIGHDCVIVRPDGWNISPEMTAIHGISHQRAMDEGISEKKAAEMYLDAMTDTELRVAHNIAFDIRIARIAMVRSGYSRGLIEKLEAMPKFCTCEMSKPIVKRPPTERMIAAGFTGFKSPNLQECMTHYFAEKIVGGHDALVDARCAGRIYFHLQTLKGS